MRCAKLVYKGQEKQAEKMFKETEGQAKQLSHVAEKRIEKSISV